MTKTINCPFYRRLLCMLYDSLLLFSVFFVATIPLLFLTEGEAVPSQNFFYPAYLLTISYFYFAWQWTHGGQTLGMRSWKVKVQTNEEKPISWSNASIRFLLAILSLCLLGLGFFIALFDRQKKALHDRYSNTQLILYT